MILDKNHFKIFRKDSELGISRPDTIVIEVSDYDTEDIYACKVMPINERTRQDNDCTSNWKGSFISSSRCIGYTYGYQTRKYTHEGAHVVKLIDFGYSFKMNFPNMKCTDFCGGTVHYISPQRIRKLPIGPEEDTWAFACVLYFLITKEFAWTGSNLVNICSNIFHKPFNPPKDATLAETQILTNIFQKDPRLRRSLSEILRHPYFTQEYYYL
ncbi:STK36 [Cordylochernes scorpioides]|uniref:STK36 n=1 Tax=Cordylochernes scorpioides TaxID=51811 RepID=A0ABY6K800_9ARAC|nr:STK36 [Cordylochernes scorpioides]